MAKTIWTILLCLSLTHCTRAPLSEREQSMRRAESPIWISDDLPFKPLIEAIERSQNLLQNFYQEELSFGPVKVPKETYINALETFQNILKEFQDTTQLQDLNRAIQRNFDFYEVYGDKKWGSVFITSYFEPVIPGSLYPTAEFSQPLYKTPEDLVEIQLSDFGEKFNDLPKTLKGRILPRKRGERIRITDYYTREEIDQLGKLERKRLEIVYTRPIDAFFLQIQGSGMVQLPSGQGVRVGYANQNGQKYVAIGKFLTDFIPLEEMTLQKIENYLRTLDKDELQDYLNRNPSYIFFRKLQSKPITFFGSEVVSGRTIATDERFFPKGTVAFLKFDSPLFEKKETDEILSWNQTSRFVLDHDRGGAIRGGGRLDLFWGSGKNAKKYAGVMKSRGKLYYLLPKGIY